MFQDIQQAERALRSGQRFVAIAIAALGLSIGANTAIFSVVNAVLLRPLSYEESDRLVVLVRTRPVGPTRGVSIPKFFMWKAGADDVLAALSVYDGAGPGMSLSHGDAPERVQAIRVSSDFFSLFRTTPSRGRFFTSADDRPGAERMVVVSHGLWTRQFGADPQMIGRAVQLNGTPHTVIGITRPDFEANPPADVWLPLQADPASTNQGHFLLGAARLKAGVTPALANTRLSVVAEDVRRRYPDAMARDESVAVIDMRQAITGDIRSMLWIIWGAVGLIQLIACANVANLLLVRAVARAKEMTLRACLGATRAQIVRHLLSESLLVAGIGGVLGLLLGVWGLRALLVLAPPDLPRFPELTSQGGLDPAVFAFAMLVSMLSGVVFGLAPALYVSRVDLNTALRDDGRGGLARRHLRMQGMIVVGELALSLVLLVGAGLLIRSAMLLNRVDPGFHIEDVLTFKTTLGGERYATTDAVTQYARTLTERVEQVPGVLGAAYVSFLPTEQSPELGFEILGRGFSTSNAGGAAKWRFVSHRFCAVLGLRVLRGRGVAETDSATSPPVVVINEALARKYWPSEDPLGQRIVIGGSLGPRLSSAAREVVGIVADARESGLALDPPPVMYLPQPQMTDAFTALTNSVVSPAWVVRTAGDPMRVADRLRQVVTSIDPRQASAEWRPMRIVLGQSRTTSSFLLTLLTLFAAVALGLAAIGIYGVFSYALEQRATEIAIRSALGAAPRQILALVWRRGLLVTALGVVIGLACAGALVRVLAAMLFAVHPTDTLTFAAAATILSTVAAGAFHIPARRLARVDPAITLRRQ